MNGVLFIRHAETDMAGTFCGHSNPPINARGRQQIQTLMNALDGEEIECIFTSDLERAAYTASTLADAFGIPCIKKPDLREINFGRWEGLTWQQIQELDEAYTRRWTETYPNLPALGGESFAEFQTRVIAEVTEILNSSDLRKVAVVTHAGVMRVVLQAMCGLAESEAWELTKHYCSFFTYPREVTR
ncbi:MAG TPA: histidine phosphatase family protein [Edaphobacter sp.]|nr:histidine phosphatase family protein [Edaphobacter sp.]